MAVLRIMNSSGDRSVRWDRGKVQVGDPEAIAAVKEAGPKRRIAGLIVDGGVARHGHEVTQDGKPVGRVTSGTFGPTVGKNIALAYVPAALSNSQVSVKPPPLFVPPWAIATPRFSSNTHVG